jgi:hypothetical protein
MHYHDLGWLDCLWGCCDLCCTANGSRAVRMGFPADIRSYGVTEPQGPGRGITVMAVQRRPDASLIKQGCAGFEGSFSAPGASNCGPCLVGCTINTGGLIYGTDRGCCILLSREIITLAREWNGQMHDYKPGLIVRTNGGHAGSSSP